MIYKDSSKKDKNNEDNDNENNTSMIIKKTSNECFLLEELYGRCD